MHVSCGLTSISTYQSLDIKCRIVENFQTNQAFPGDRLKSGNHEHEDTIKEVTEDAEETEDDEDKEEDSVDDDQDEDENEEQSEEEENEEQVKTFTWKMTINYGNTYKGAILICLQLQKSIEHLGDF